MLLARQRVRGLAAVYGGWVKKTDAGGYEPEPRKNTGLKGTWSDLNGDGLKQPEEWQVTDKPAYPIAGSGPQQGWGAYFDESFNLFMHDWSDDANGGVWEIPVAEWKKDEVFQKKVIRWLKGARDVHLVAPGTDPAIASPTSAATGAISAQ